MYQFTKLGHNLCNKDCRERRVKGGEGGYNSYYAQEANHWSFQEREADLISVKITSYNANRI